MNTRDTLEKCARVMGLNVEFVSNIIEGEHAYVGDKVWNPLTDNDDCAEMCAQLMIDTHWGSNTTFVEASGYDSSDTLVYYQAELKDHNNDKCAAWRHAACNVAAMMGERL